MYKLWIFAFLSLLTSCMVGPDYKEPPKRVAHHWAKKNNSIKETPPHDTTWWEVFHDDNLKHLICTGYSHNISLQSAGVRVLQARSQLAQSVGQLYPQQQAMIGNYTYNRIGGSSLQTVLPSSFDTALLGFTATWELDFWGKYRRAIQSNDAAFLASLAAYDNAIVTLTADIAGSYIKIRTNEALYKVTEENIKVQTIGLRIAKSRYNAGQASLIDVEQAQTELAETQARLPTISNDIQHNKDALAVLLGLVPTDIDKFIKPKVKIPKAPAHIAVGIPKESLARRPDIYQARMEAISQLALIGATKANLFPSFSLTGTFAFTSNNIGNNSISDLFNWSNRFVTAGPTLNWPILNYGQITNAVRTQDAVFQQALLKYINLVLQAQQEVQDNISSYIEAKNAEKYLVIADVAAIKATKLTLVRYREGETDFTPVLDALQQQLRVQTSLTKTQGDIPLAVIALYRSLGGGWQIRNGNDIVPRYIKAEMASRTDWGNLLAPPNHQAPVTPWDKIKQIYLPNW